LLIFAKKSAMIASHIPKETSLVGREMSGEPISSGLPRCARNDEY
jgi:hypothetical protein